MPTAPPSRCNQPGCPTLTTSGRCPEHTRQPWQSKPNAPWAGGSTRRWRTERRRHLHGNPLCTECQREGHIGLATTVDHIHNLAAGGPMWDRANLQSLCQRHADAKNRRESAAGRRRQAAQD